jgi:hypothetical protein
MSTGELCLRDSFVYRTVMSTGVMSIGELCLQVSYVYRIVTST